MATGIENLKVFQKSFNLAMEVFEISKTFPTEEKYSLTDQLRRSSRAVCANMSEAYRKRRYEAHFISKISDADMENTETQTWLKFCYSCKYISQAEYDRLRKQSEEIGKMLDHMIKNPAKYQRNW